MRLQIQNNQSMVMVGFRVLWSAGATDIEPTCRSCRQKVVCKKHDYGGVQGSVAS
jgi:hypothetical protein